MVVAQSRRSVGAENRLEAYATLLALANPVSELDFDSKKIGGEINLLLFIRTTVANTRRPIS